MEKTKKTKLLPMSLAWSDIWSWDSFFENTVEDVSANVIIGNVICNNVRNSLIYNWSSKKIIVDNLDNMIYVSTDENTYITKRWNSENIKNLL
jgi:mannose-1-phosphate guanylyltransferase/mannose-6-phosphate isomerase